MSDSTLLHHIADTAPDIAAALDLRANITAMTQAAEDAVLIPHHTGAWSHDLRHALAARIARLHGAPDIADTYVRRCNDPALKALADPAVDGSEQNLAHVCGFIDRVAAQTRDIKASDISGLQSAGVSDADIVRLCELAAFLSYQLRSLIGVRLMAEVWK